MYWSTLLRDSPVQYIIVLWVGWRGSILVGVETFLFASASQSALGPTQPSIHRALGAFFFRRKRDRGVKLTTHIHLMPNGRLCSAVLPPFSYMSSCLIKHKDNFFTLHFSAFVIGVLKLHVLLIHIDRYVRISWKYPSRSAIVFSIFTLHAHIYVETMLLASWVI
jgi:hypothetical protein